MDLQAAYRGVRERLTRDLTELGDDAASATVPACPEWTVKDVVAHLAGILADIQAGNLAGTGTDDWTAKHVADRADTPLEAILEEWASLAAVLEPTIPSFPPAMVAPLVADAYTHEQDVRGAIGVVDGRDSEAAAITLDSFLERLDERLTEGGLALTVRYDGTERTLGTGAPQATLDAEGFELLRTITGRRSPDQIRAMAWQGDLDRILPLLSHYPVRDTPLSE